MRKFKQPKWKVLGKRRARERKKLFIVITLGCKCSNCGQTNPDLLQFHHPNSDRTYTSGITCKSWSFIKNEIATKHPHLLCIKCNGLDGRNYQTRTSH